jgi:hypothetical protein
MYADSIYRLFEAESLRFEKGFLKIFWKQQGYQGNRSQLIESELACLYRRQFNFFYTGWIAIIYSHQF